ncbi:MAG TPA: hypothetical protein EYG28_04345 [Nitrospiria bacterium]|nr:hypothetical protein [Candidatus Manganitrophaceae bacterium]HIL34619.1 hypothetical protein [Candidatus Manganitrophaceae bacterium]
MYKIKSKAWHVSSGIAVAVLSLGIIAFSVGDAYAQTSDFFSSTQSTDKRAGLGSAVVAPGSVAATNPGFNPCSGGGLLPATRDAGGACLNADGTSLLSLTNLTATFQQAGPGAITDNMFGIVSGADASLTPITTGKCGKLTNAALGGLNCGSLRITPDAQGQVIPSFPAANTLTSIQSGNFDLAFDSNPLLAGHMGMNLTNRFVWIPNATGSTAAVGTQIACAALAGGSGTTPNICSDQRMRQVTQIGAGVVGTEVAPGPADQVVDITTVFQTLSTTDTSIAGLPPAAFNVVMTSTITDPDMTGGGAGFSQTIGFTFIHNELVPDGLGAATQVFACPGTVVGNICTQYPDGQSMTSGSLAGAELPPQ